MKKIIMALIIILFGSFMAVSIVFAAADTWTQKADVGGTVRGYATGFSIGSKGYIGTGHYGTAIYTDFWEYDPAADTWTQKADFGGTKRHSATGFSIGSKGYIGIGYTVSGTTGIYLKDFWEYDLAANKWTKKADFGGGVRTAAIGFSIGSKGYIGTGSVSSTKMKDFWEYDPASDTWTRKADFGGGLRYAAVGFSIGSKGYIGTGANTSSSMKDFWEYNPISNTWTQKKDFSGIARSKAVGFSIGSKGYIGTGWVLNSAGTYAKDFWEYDSDSDTWIQKEDFGGTARLGAVGLSIGSNGYIGTGFPKGGGYVQDFWEYEPSDIPANTSVTMTFEGLTDWEIVGDYYNGGYGYDYYTGKPKSGPGPNYGVIFPRGFAAIDSDEGGTGNFGGEPSPSTAVWFQQGGGAWMNVTNGFTGSLSFYYSNPNNPSRIYIYDGLNRTGNLLATLDLPLTPYKGAMDPTGNLGPFVYVTVSFTGVAKSVDFSAEAHSAYIDDITLGALVAQGTDTTPDPFTFNYEADVDLNTVITSNTITVTGITAPAPISVTGGTYSVNGSTYTSVNGTVKNGDKVTVQQTSSGNYLTTTVVTLTIGGVADTFSVTTKETSIITLNPVANKTVLWPPNNKMVAIIIQANASDSSGGPVTLKAAVSCNESASLGRDWTNPIINQKKGVITLSFRATRNGSGTGRVYTINITATGAEGNSATKAVTVTVPHDQSVKGKR